MRLRNKKNHKVLKIVLFLIAVVAIVVFFLCNIIVTYNRTTSIDAEITSLSDDEATTVDNTVSDLSEYKQTSELTDEDKDDEYQKNYQSTTVDDENYLIKTVEWTDKENGEAVITIRGSQTFDTTTTALYVTTLCYAHGLSQSIIISNIEYLTQYYDEVDFVVVAYNPNSSYNWFSAVTYTSENFDSSTISTYLTTIWNYYGVSGQHFTDTIVPAIQTYLFGGFGDSYISEDNLINEPVAIYVSFDGFDTEGKAVGSSGSESLAINEDWAEEYATSKYFNFIEEKWGDNYCTMCSSYGINPVYSWNYNGWDSRTVTTSSVNSLLGIIDPEYYGMASSLISNSKTSYYSTYLSTTNTTAYRTLDASSYGADYSYSETFEDAGVTIVTGASIVDIVVNEYEIISVEAYDGYGSELSITVDGQTITINDSSYNSGDEIVVKIYIKLNSDTLTNFDDFTDTNVGSATISSTAASTTLTVESPQLSPVTSNYTVKYVDINSNEEISDEKINENIAVNTNIYATNELVEFDGYTYLSCSADTLVVSNDEEENVLILYYAKNTVLYVNYIDEVTGEILSSYSEDGYEGKSYTTSDIEIDDYVLVETPENSSGEMEYPTTTVNYYYRMLSVVTTRYIDIVSGEEIEESVSVTYKEGDEYNTEQKEISEYRYVSDTGNTSGTIERVDIEVIYYYSNIATVSITKVSQSDSGTTLEGAKFSLYVLICEDETHEHDTDDDLIDVADVDESCWELEGTYTSDEDGIILLENLPIVKTYRLVETKAADGYVLPAGQWKIEFDYGQLDESETITVDGVEMKITAIGNPPALSLVDGVLYLYNEESFDMPTAGGLGSSDFAQIGLAIMIVGAYWLIWARVKKYCFVGNGTKNGGKRNQEENDKVAEIKTTEVENKDKDKVEVEVKEKIDDKPIRLKRKK